MTNSFEKIGVWQTAFLGDALLTLPLLRTLRATYPDAELHYYVRKGFGPLFAAHADLTAVHEFDKRGTQRSIFAAYQLGRQLASQHFDLWVGTHRSVRSSVVALASQIPMRIGYNRPAHTRAAYTHTVSRRFGHAHEIERLLGLLEPLGIPQTDYVYDAALTFADQPTRTASEWLTTTRATHPGKPVIGLHPGSAWPTKRWPAHHVATLATQLLDAGCVVALFAGPAEKNIAKAISTQVCAHGTPKRYHDLSGTLDLPTLGAVLGGLDAYVGNDSGPTHIAWMQHTPTVALFGPTDTSLGFCPRGPCSRILQLPMECSPCGLHGAKRCPKGHHNCMEELTPHTVRDAVQKLLAPSHTPLTTPPPHPLP